MRIGPDRARLTVPAGAWWLVLTLAFAFGLAPVMPAAAAQAATPQPADSPALAAAIDFLLAQQDAAGAFPGLDGNADPSLTADALLALGAAATQDIDTAAATTAALASLQSEAGLAYAALGPGQAAKVVLAAVAAGADPRAFAGEDLTVPIVAALAAGSATPGAGVGLAAGSAYQHALCLLALAAAGSPAPESAIAALRATQSADGGWSFTGDTAPGAADSNTTALVVQALVATGHGDDPMIAAGLAYLRAALTDLGQFRYQAGTTMPADANSTALAVQAVIATGNDPGGADWRDATRGLAAFQNKSGGFRYVDEVPADNLLATVQAIPALAGVALPVTPTAGAGSAASPVAVMLTARASPAQGRAPAPDVAAAA